ncbi:MAG: dephospho-CoA kinase [Vampirovibrionales bacterium]|nr:dephospho-CoA kinase [Vampirovibrionales bacterium]
MVYKIGITGNIGCGKSTVGGYLQGLNAAVIDADTIVHELLAHDADIQKALIEQFGSEILNPSTQQIDRAELAARIFGPQQQSDRRKVEHLLHPRVRQKIQAFFLENQGKPVAFALIPLLFENNLDFMVDETWLVAIAPDIQRERLMRHRAMSPAAIEARLAAQMPQQDKLARAHWTLWNNESTDVLFEKIRRRLSAQGLVDGHCS